MQQLEQSFKGRQQCLLRRSPPDGLIPAVEDRFDQFQIPVAEFMPDKLVNASGRLIEAVFIQALDNLIDGLIESRKDPAIGERKIRFA